MIGRIDLPTKALSIRQPWAWAIIIGAKDVENRSNFAVSKGDLHPRRIAVHAAKGMTQDEYEDAAHFMMDRGVHHIPRPDQLVRGAIIGAVTVTAVVGASDSPWFVGPRGLLLADAEDCEPIPAMGALGYFTWVPAGAAEDPLPWMRAWPEAPRRARYGRAPAALPLFEKGEGHG